MNIEKPPVLIVAFRRSVNLKRIIQICLEEGASRIYVALDGPRTEEEKIDTNACADVLKEYEIRYPGKFFKKISSSNLGSAVSVLSGCDWVFSKENFSIIIEDDCIPDHNFFSFIMDAKPFLEIDEKCLIISGTQFASTEITEDRWSLSHFPMIWGWATTKTKWENFRNTFKASFREGLKKSELTWAERTYWKSGYRRSIQGYLDSWAIPMFCIIRHMDWYGIAPGVNLIENIGVDDVATHTTKDSKWLKRKKEAYIVSSEPPTFNLKLDTWIQKKFYGIGLRHLFSTKVTHLLDIVAINKAKKSPLKERWMTDY